MRVDNDFNKWNINKLPRTRGAQGVGSSNGIVTLTAGNREGKGYPELEAHYLWGQFFNGKQDVNGDITTDGNVNFHGNLNFLGEYDSDDDLRGNLNIGNVNAVNGHFKEMNTDILKAAEAYINNLTVTGSAHFFELIIDKIRSVGGAIMLTPGDGFELWGYNLSGENNINLWWVRDDVKGAKYNHWKVDDQALCKTFDDSVIGQSTYIKNKNWWAKVVAVNESPTWCVKLGTDEYNPDLVTSLPNNTYYNNTHSYLRKTDFIPSDKYVYVYIESEIVGGIPVYHRDRWISNEEYFNLSDSDKSKYEYSQLYIHQNEDGSVIQITKLQYENTEPINTDLLVYDNKEKSWRLLRDFCKADCKSCFSITIDKTQCSPDSKFGVSGSNYTAYVFQEGDNIVMLGNQTDANRQNAIYLNAGAQGDSLDTDIRPPFFAQYKGINDFNLTNHRLTWFSGGWIGAQGTQGTQGFANNIQGNLKIATGESVEEYVGSEIIAQSDAITMRVKSDMSEAGITIHDDEIILDADKTTVTGTLQLNDNKTGLVLYDNGLPVISILNTPTGDITDTRTPLNTRDTIELTTPTSTAIFHMKQPYAVKSGKTYNLKNLIASCVVGSSGANISSVEITITLRRKDNNNIVILPETLSKTISGTGQGYVAVGDFSFAANYTGQVYIDVSMTVYFNQTYGVGSVLYGTLSGEIIQPTNKIVKLGNDGLQVVNSSNKYCILGDSNYTLRQGNSTLSITNDYMRRSIGSSTGDIGSIVKVKVCTPGSSNNIYSPDDGLVIYSGSWGGDPVYYLPNPASTSANDGRVIHFKNLTGRKLKFRTQTTDNVLIGNDSDTPTTEITVEKRSCMMICGGGYWIFYLG